MEIKMNRVKDFEDFRNQYWEGFTTDGTPAMEMRVIIEVAEKPFVDHFNKEFAEQYESHKKVRGILIGETIEDIDPKNVYETWFPNFGHVKVITKE